MNLLLSDIFSDNKKCETNSLFGHQNERFKKKCSVENEILSTNHQVNKIKSYPCIESASTISNSSLQDLDKIEFMGTELARYMGVLNFDHVT